MSEFGAALRRRRKHAGLSLAEFGRRTHFSPGYLSKIENGHSRASRYIAEVCDQALDAGGDLLVLVPDDGSGQPAAGLPDVGPVLLGRGTELEQLTADLLNPRGPAALVIAGLPGIGKTALAVAAARRSAQAFSGGLSFVDLGPPEQPAPTAAETLDRALRALGVPGRQIPEHESGRLALLRERVLGRPALLIADDAASAAQLRPLLAAGPDCRLLVTSRRRLTALDEAEHLVLGPLPDASARDLFRRISGFTADRASEASAVEDSDGGVGGGVGAADSSDNFDETNEPQAPDETVDALVDRCAAVPLAVRIVAARLRDGAWTAAELLDRLTDRAAGLAGMNDGERSMAAALSTSIDGLAGPERTLLALLSIHPGPAADLPAVSALAGLAPTRAEVLLTRLHESCLLTRRPGGLVVLHDLVRAHLGAEELPQLAPDIRAGALERYVTHLVGRVATADAAIEPHRYRPLMDLMPVLGFADRAAAQGWLRAQWPATVDALTRAYDAGLLEPCWQLGFLLRGFFFQEKLTEPWLRSGRLALAAAERGGARTWAGMLHNSLGMAYLERGEFAEAVACHDRAEVASAAAGDSIGATDARASRAWVRLYEGAHERALVDFDAALAAYGRQHRPRSECIALRGRAFAAAELGRDEDAMSCLHRAAPLAQTRLDRAMTSNCAGWVAYRAGRFPDAARHYAAAADLSRGESDYELTWALTGLANTAAAIGDRSRAEQLWGEADRTGAQLDPRTTAEAAVRPVLEKA
jgi:transcriptional regulator with XRE-family HTH domain/tetratricopeptide (TPR) repeat protein